MVVNKLLIGVGGTVAAVALTIGVVSAAAGRPIAFDSGDSSVQEVDEPSPSPSSTPVDDEQDENDVDDSDEANEQDDETDGEENDIDDADEADDDDGDSAGNQKIAEAIAEEFETTPEEVLALHDDGIGFGALFKLYLIARAKGITVYELIAQIEEDGGGFAFGKLKKSLTEDEMAIFEDGPNNLGELVSGSNHDDSEDLDDAEAENAGDEGESSHGGPPDHAKAKGNGKKR